MKNYPLSLRAHAASPHGRRENDLAPLEFTAPSSYPRNDENQPLAAPPKSLFGARPSNSRATAGRSVAFALGCAIALLAPRSAYSQTTTWLGGTGSWFSSGNWSAGAPTASTDPGIASGTAQVTSPGAVGFYLTVGPGEVLITSGGTLTVAKTTIDSPTGGSIVVDGTGGTGTNFTSPSSILIGEFSGDSGTLTIQNGGAVTVPGLNGNGVVLGNASGAAGTLQLNSGGILQVGGSAGITNGGGTSVFNFAGGTVQAITANLTVSVGATLIGTTSTIDTNGLNATFSGALAGPGALTKIGAGTLYLTKAVNNYFGGTNINAGTVAIGSEFALGRGNISLGGGELLAQSTLTLINPTFTWNSGTSTVSAAAGAILTLNPTQEDPGKFVINTGANLVFGSAGNTGTVVLGDKAVSGTPGSLTVAFGTLTEASGTLNNVLGYLTSNATSTTVNSGATLNFSDNNSTIANLLGSGSVVTGVSAGTVITIDQGTFSGAISGAGEVFKTTSGVLTLTGANTYAGPTVINGGVLQIASDANLGAASGSVYLYNFATLRALANATSSRALVLNPIVQINNRIPLLPSGGTIDTNGYALTWNGAISGAGSLTKAGLGILTLTGTNTYYGGTFVTGGLINFASLANFGAGNITLNGGGLQWATGNTLDVSGILNAFGSGGAAFDTNGNNVTLANPLTGAGSLTKQGLGILTLATTNAYQGGTVVTGGLINFSSFATFGSGNITLNGFSSGNITLNGGGLQWAVGNTADVSGSLNPFGLGGATIDTNGNNVTLASALTGAGSLTKQGVGILTLKGTNTYQGGAVVTAGLINFASLSNFGSGNITLNGGGLQWATSISVDVSGILNPFGAGGATFDTNGNNVTLASALTGAGSLTKVGLGVLALTGTNTYQGSTVVTGGMIAFSSLANFGSGNITLNGGGLKWAAGNTVDVSAILNPFGSGGAAFDTNGNSVTLASSLTGPGALTKQGGGVLTLTGINTYQGGTAVTGGMIAFSSLANFGSGNITLNGGGLKWAASNTADVSGVLNPFGSGGAIFDTAGNNVALARSLTGAGALAKQGGGVLTLSATNTYQGGTFVTGGAIAFSSLANFGSSNITLNGGGLTWATGNTADVSGILNPFGSGGATFNTNGNNVTLASPLTGAGGLTKDGLGILTLKAANTYQGGTVVDSGLINFAGLANFGSGKITLDGGGLQWAPGNTADVSGILNPFGSHGATFSTNGNNVTLASSLTGAGGLIKDGVGILTLTGTNTYQGGTTVTGGQIDFASLANFGSGKITLNGGGLQWAVGNTADVSGILNPFGTHGATFDTNGNNVTMAGALTGAGSLTKTGLGILTLTGTNTYQGGSFITAGLINFASLANFGSGTITVNGGGLQWAAGNATDVSGNLSPIGSGGATFDTNGNNVTLAGAITGAGGLTKQGAGELILSGANTYAGNTIVSSGSLFVDGSIASPTTTVNQGALIGGFGVIGGSLLNGGAVSPGDAPGTLTIAGNYTQSPTGALIIRIGGTAPLQHDLLAVGGVASLNGALQLQQVGGFKFQLGQEVTVLTASGGISGQFSSVINPFASGPLFGIDVVYLPNFVEVERVQLPFTSIPGETPNERAVARVLDHVFTYPIFANLITRLDNEPVNQLLNDLNRLGPEELTSIFEIAISQAEVQTFNLQRRFEDLRAGSSGFSSSGFSMNGVTPGFTGPLGDAGLLQGPDGKSGKTALTPAPDNRWGVFATGTGEFTSLGDTDNARGYDLNSATVTLGVDYKVTDHLVIGLAGGYDHSDADLVEGGRVTVDGGKLALYSTYFTGKGFYTDLAVQGGYNSYDTTRGAVGSVARATTDGGELNVLFGTGYEWKVGGLTFGPTANFEYSYIGLNGTREIGSLAPLDIATQSQDSLRTTFGAKASYNLKIGGVTVVPELRLGWLHEYGDNPFEIVSQFQGGGSSFAVQGPATGRDGLVVGAGFAVRWSDRFSTYFYYDGELGRTNYQSNNVSGGFRLEF